MLLDLRQTGTAESFQGRRGLRLRVLASAEGDSRGGEQGPLVVGRDAAHSNAQKERNGSIDSLLDYRENTEGKGENEAKGQKRQKK